MSNPFSIPTVNGTIAATASSQRISMPGTGGSIMIQNTGGTECFVAVGDSTVTATAGGSATAAADGGMSVPPGIIAVYSIPQTATHLAAICAAGGTTTLRVSRGSGV